MVRGFHARVSRSCANCRAVKRRCDQQVPHCGQCIRMREVCPGYRDEWDLVFRDQTGHTIQKHKPKRAKREKSTILATNNALYSPIPLSLAPSHDEIGVNYFLHHFMISNHVTSSGYLNYIPAIDTVPGYHPTLLASMAAVGLVALANITRHPELGRHAGAKYSEAINMVNIALESQTECLKDSTLMSVISLGLFEYNSGFASWARHVQGAAALVSARGSSQFGSSAAFLMFNQVRADMVAACIHGGQPFPNELHELQQEATKLVDATSVFWRLGVAATRCTDFFRTVKMQRRGNAWPRLLDQASGLQEELHHIFAILSIKSPYTSSSQAGGNPEIFYHDRFDLYKNIWAIRIWNSTRILQIKICDSIRYIINNMLAAEIETLLHEQIREKLENTMDLLSKLGRDMIASVPQALGAVFPVSETNLHMAGSSSTISVSSGYMMTWPLYTAGKSSTMEPEARRWIIRRLQDFSRIQGISLASQLVQDLIRMDHSVNRANLILISGPFRE